MVLLGSEGCEVILYFILLSQYHNDQLVYLAIGGLFPRQDICYISCCDCCPSGGKVVQVDPLENVSNVFIRHLLKLD